VPGSPTVTRVAELDRVAATGPVLSHHGDTKEAQLGDDPPVEMAQARLEQVPARVRTTCPGGGDGDLGEAGEQCPRDEQVGNRLGWAVREAAMDTGQKAAGGPSSTTVTNPSSAGTTRGTEWPGRAEPSGRAGLDESGLVGEHDRLDPVVEAELHQQVSDVALDRRLADH
jgi:hypothetical protein